MKITHIEKLEDEIEDIKDYDICTPLPCGFEFAEVLIFAKVNNYIPERPAPVCSNPDSPLFSDCGDPSEIDYTLKGFIRFEPDRVGKSGDPEGLMIELTDEQLSEIDEHFDILPEIEREFLKRNMED